MVDKKLFVTYLAGLGQKKGITGGDNILIEFSRRWADKHEVMVITGSEGWNVCQERMLTNVRYEIISNHWRSFRYVERLYHSIKEAFRFNNPGSIVYTSSDFLHDSLFGFIVKRRNPSVTWWAGCYLVVPNPFSRETPYRGWIRIRGLLYWLSQQPVIWAINKYADKVLVTSDFDKPTFRKKNPIAVKGGTYIRGRVPFIPVEQKSYDAVFMGRFHWQKGVKECVDIWSEVTSIYPKAKLLMIGDGPQHKYCVNRAKKLGLEKNIDFILYASENQKELFFRCCKMFLHTSIYESGGMSAAEAMAYGCPAVGFDLPVYGNYYPKGFLKSKGKKEFVNNIIKLLNNNLFYYDIQKEVYKLIEKEWGWDKRFTEVDKDLNS